MDPNSTQTPSVIFVTGGAKSGKTRYALATAQRWPGKLLYIATAEPRDEEMQHRIDAHRRERGERWETIEAPLDLVGALTGVASFGGILVDCLTLWTSNLMEAHPENDGAVLEAADRLVEALARCPVPVVVVTNEVGGGIVPAHPVARKFRDLAGAVNQRVAMMADEAYLVVSGRPLRLG